MFETEPSPKAFLQKAPSRRLTLPSAGMLLLICALILCAPRSLRAATMTEIYGFPSGESPYAGVIQGSNGNLYGTTPVGGPNKKGTVYQITTAGALVYSIPFNGINGANPQAPLVQAADGTLYGTTSNGGAQGKGTVFKISPDGALSVLFSFAKTNGSLPWGGLTLVSNKMLYGTTAEGGANGDGTVFKITTSGAFQMLLSFSGTNGANPYAGLTLGKNGSLYGTTKYGGNTGQGTAFLMTPSGNFTNLVSFTGDNGAYPNGLILAADGNFYGTAAWGGVNSLGLVFKLKPSGSISTVEAFAGFNGAVPNGSLLQAANGNFYGTTQLGGDGFGTVFKLNNSALTSLISFDGTTGSSPECALIQAADSKFYGTTQAGGSTGHGNVFQLAGFSPVIVTPPANQTVTVGSTVIFTASALASPPFFFQWQKNGFDLIDSGNISGTATSQLTLTNVSLADAGVYKVTVTNGDGTDTASATLVVKADTIRPTVAFTSPAANARSNSFVLTGLATDNGQVASVSYWITNINNGVTTINASNQATLEGTNIARLTWTATPDLLPGTNIVAVQAQDSQTNNSLVATRTVFAIQQTPLTLTTVGTGSGTFVPRAALARDILPANGALLNTGEGYSLQAKPGKNSLFAGWTGSLGAQTNATLSFIMEPGLTLQANFVTNRFLVAAGIYNGLFFDTNNLQPESSGALSGLSVNTLGRYSGRLVLGGAPLTISGGFDPNGAARQSLKTAQGLVLLELSFDWNTGKILGTLAQTNGWTAALTAERAGNPLPAAAVYNFLIPPVDTVGTNSPVGYSYGHLSNRAGAVTLSGSLADGTALSQTLPISVDSRIPIYATLYKNSGVLLGWIDLSSGSPVGEMTWLKKPSTGVFPLGFTNQTAISGSRWTPPARNTFALTQTNFAVTLWGADLSAPIRCQVQVTPAYRLVKVNSVDPQLASTNAVSGLLDSKTGLLKLTFATGNGKTSVTASGAVNPPSGAGEFTNNKAFGAFTLVPLALP